MRAGTASRASGPILPRPSAAFCRTRACWRRSSGTAKRLRPQQAQAERALRPHGRVGIVQHGFQFRRALALMGQRTSPAAGQHDEHDERGSPGEIHRGTIPCGFAQPIAIA